VQFFNSLAAKHAKTKQGYIIYGGNKKQDRSLGTVISWQHTDSILE
jgi:hypothetical protein